MVFASLIPLSAIFIADLGSESAIFIERSISTEKSRRSRLFTPIIVSKINR